MGWLPKLVTTVPGSLGGHQDSPASHDQRILSPDFLACDVRGLHIQSIIQHQEICIRQERKQAAEAGWEELGSLGRASPHPRNGSRTAVQCHPRYGGCAPCLADTRGSIHRARGIPPASKGKTTGAKTQSKSQAERVSLQHPLKQATKMCSQLPLLCCSTWEPSHHCPHTSTCCPHTSTCIGVII